ncbi:hypothetical protein AAFF_G00187680 [Aldrovandia affinis]|uniref:Uncharacterized protein n=1 Tax=Aldrovandia affinis TaxID=143900 RepID=A0AAD7SZZ3_9TELE|nr:hypothetical protein AAFF_G00187680 [Aldrovandia affinis]
MCSVFSQPYPTTSLKMELSLGLPSLTQPRWTSERARVPPGTPAHLRGSPLCHPHHSVRPCTPRALTAIRFSSWNSGTSLPLPRVNLVLDLAVDPPIAHRTRPAPLSQAGWIAL